MKVDLNNYPFPADKDTFLSFWDNYNEELVKQINKLKQPKKMIDIFQQEQEHLRKSLNPTTQEKIKKFLRFKLLPFFIRFGSRAFVKLQDAFWLYVIFKLMNYIY